MRSVASVVSSVATLEGAGVQINRSFPTHSLDLIDPFLLLDEMGPLEFGPGQLKGFPDHPHRGFETVSYILEGSLVHRDSRGNSGHLGPGDVQWMTAGAGLVHSEMPGEELARSGGRMHGFQLWVNLPARDKMVLPRYQDVPSASIPVVESEDGRVRVKVIAGEALGARAVIDTHTPITYLHFSFEPGASVVQIVPQDHNAFAYVISGSGRVDPEADLLRRGQLAILREDGDQVFLQAAEHEHFDVLLIAGVPLGEPVARYGPFVMNTAAEIRQAILDYQNGSMGTIDA